MEIVEVGKEGLTFKALVSVRPEVKLGQYKGLTAPKEEVKVTDEGHRRRAEALSSTGPPAWSASSARPRRATPPSSTSRALTTARPSRAARARTTSLELGSGSFVPGFEEQVIGMKAGEEKDLDITFPEDYHARPGRQAGGLPREGQRGEGAPGPEVDDEFAKDVSEFETLADFRKDLGEKLPQRRQAAGPERL